jgi:hypothetical protein
MCQVSRGTCASTSALQIVSRQATCPTRPCVLNLHDLVERTSPSRPGGNLGAVGVDGLPVELTTTTVDIHLVGAEPAGALPGETNDPEEDDNEEGEVAGEETLGVVQFRARGGDGVVELGAAC